MGRPPSNGGPSFRFTQAEIAEMEAILQAHKTAMPERQVLVSLAEKFSKSEERAGKIEVQMKQVWNWFQNRRYAIRAKAAKAPGNLNATQMVHDSSMVKGVPQVTQVTQPHAAAAAAASVNVRSFPQAPQHPTVPSASVRTFPQAPQQPPVFSVQSAGRVADNSQMEFEAKSARDGAWYDVSTFISHRSLETGDPEVFVRFAGFGAEEDEWVNVRKNVRQRSLPCEASECVAVLPADLILCFQEGKEQALYFDAHVLDAQRRRHDVRGCRCRFLVRYDHDQSEEIVALRKICRRPETDYRLQQLHAVNESIAANQNKNGANNNNHTVNTLRVYPPAEVQPKQHKVEPVAVPSPSPPEAPQKRQRLDSTVAPEGSQPQFKAESVVANVPQNQQTVQLAVPVVPARSDEVPVELQKVQPLTSNPIIEVEPRNVAADVPSLSEPKPELRAEEQISEAVGPVIPPSAGALLEEKTELAEPQKEPVVSGASVEVPAELLDVQPDVPDQPHTSALETKLEDPVLFISVDEPNVVEEVIETKTEDVVPVSSGDPNVVQEAMESKTEEAVVLVSGNNPNVVQEAKTYESVVPIESNVVQEAIETKSEEPVVPVVSNVAQEVTTEEPVVPVDSHVAQEATTEEPVVPVESNVAQEATTEQPVVPDDSNLATTTEESVMLVDSNVAQEATTEETMVPVDSNMAHEATTEEPVVPVDSTVAQEATTKEPVVPVDSTVAQEARTEEPVVTVDPIVAQEAKTEEPAVPVNDRTTGIETEIEQAKVSEMEIDEEKAGDNAVENMDVTQENAAVAMEEG
ncbi:putative transcription factor homeobox-WOX family [Helianthus annuus]|nr:putative transcription factor homeobox-WOX family [Helianthus annuus]